MNIRQAQIKARDLLAKNNINAPELDAKVLLANVIDQDDTALFKSSDAPLTNSQYSKYLRHIKRRARGEPVAYITHQKEFYGYNFYINNNVLIPRPETELLVEEAIKFIKSKVYKVESSLNIIDIGTGSGCIIISIIKAISDIDKRLSVDDVRFSATDISKKAIYVAKINTRKHGVVDKIKFYRSDLFSNKKMLKKYDIIIANLPYVPKSNIKNLPDPNLALDGGGDGTDIIKNFLDQAKTRLNNDGVILLEIGFNQAKDIREYAKKIMPKSKIQVIKDLAGLDRVIKIVFDN
ncbi:protein-(glutamine-N5) methyltransferase, release factor-specific [Candidatus Berkelbacteria bacterium RIFOXYA2_FULL_43_10]|uniref:Protein-(Glutamine-N5) methyltransferase, release factor-specific n=1 Tax=Candidatus Berkelbacteria bacterium RIFOXYA2_FULL_43_10 TaxID=1797472 RepID=A0A1F5EE30_9BACT|nr:MAG: protein-(glutamine-N5) methyltransferase, release factor-specific [Candidatus Berkelbacteria bacterium RIFOXYA2_FULL_43_10]